jgi:peptide/nickel transport system substrate-binding protein
VRGIRSKASVLLVAGLLLAACGGTEPNSSSDSTAAATADTSDGTVVVGFVLEPVNLDISGTAGAPIPQVLLGNVYEGLVRIDESGAVVPLLARDFSVSNDGLTYTFLLGEATFHDGSPMTAADVAWSLRRVADQSATDVLPAVLQQFARVADVSVDGDEIVLTLSERDNDLLFNLTQRGGVILREGATGLAETANGTGPFRLGTWDRGNSITLERFDGYWGEPAASAKVVFRYIQDATALSNAILAGEIDVLSTVQAPELLSAFDGRSDLVVQSGTTSCEVTLGMNNSRAPLDDVRVRRAIRHAIDKRALIDTAWAGYGLEIGSFVPPTDPWYEDLSGLVSFDPDEARRLLAAAGVAPGTTLTLDVPPVPYALNSQEFIAASLAKVGLDVTIRPIEWAEWIDRVFTKADYDLTIVCHVEQYDMAIYANPEYYFRYDSQPYRDLIAAAAGAPGQSERTDALRAAARLLADDSASDWLWLLPNLQVSKTSVSGVPMNAVGDAYSVAILRIG